jgi:hypothetical protein
MEEYSMMKSCGLFLLAMLAFPLEALADDPALAAKLVGSWEGRWEYGDVGGKLTARITSAKDNSLEGETKWFGTVAGDVDRRREPDAALDSPSPSRL